MQNLYNNSNQAVCQVLLHTEIHVKNTVMIKIISANCGQVLRHEV